MVRTERALVFFMLGSVVALFLFPISFGSFQSTNGPTTTLDVKGAQLLPPVVLQAALAFFLISWLMVALASSPASILVEDRLVCPGSLRRALNCSLLC